VITNKKKETSNILKIEKREIRNMWEGRRTKLIVIFGILSEKELRIDEMPTV